ncbi:unnamed protein product [Rangifer tarandus platyrhynchus]|uniref:Uncharacterized protein n=1 Tax=Rangifer tarandus platyrhynchus TaxID=3082113 RepID=A0ABN8Z872_RANTA|nr:unnamed protein product [Rangifer tarandus platyrhynchus]
MLFEVTVSVVNVYTAIENSGQHHCKSPEKPSAPAVTLVPCHLRGSPGEQARQGCQPGGLEPRRSGCPGPDLIPCSRASFLSSLLESSLGTSLVVQWPRLRAQRRGPWARPLVRELDPACRRRVETT